MTQLRGAALLLALPVLALSACGSDDKKDTSTKAEAGPKSKLAPKAPEPSGDGSEIELAAKADEISFDKRSLKADAGKVTIIMDNAGPIPHAVAVRGKGVKKKGKTVTKGHKSTVSVRLKPGKYRFYCPTADHELLGMKGILTVN